MYIIRYAAFMDCFAGWHKCESKIDGSKRQELSLKGEFGCPRGSSDSCQLSQTMFPQHWDPRPGGNNMRAYSVIGAIFSSLLTNWVVYWYCSLRLLVDLLETTMPSSLWSSVIECVKSHIRMVVRHGMSGDLSEVAFLMYLSQRAIRLSCRSWLLYLLIKHKLQ
jgi:hypothetical protein